MASASGTNRKLIAVAYLIGITIYGGMTLAVVEYASSKVGTEKAHWTWAAAVFVTLIAAACTMWIQRRLSRREAAPGPDVAEDRGCQETLQQHGIILHEVLGRGMFGTVYKGEYQGGTVAVKIAEVTVPRARAKSHLTEVRVASSLTHPNVVHLYKAIVKRVRPSRGGLRSHSSLGSKASSDWGDLLSSSPGDPGGRPVEGAMSPGAMSNLSSASEAAWSYNRVSSPSSGTVGSPEMEGMGSPPMSPPADYDSIPPPPKSAFQPAPPLQTPQRQSSGDSSSTQWGLSFLTPRLSRKHSSGAEGALGGSRKEGEGNKGQDLGAARSASMVTFCCIFVMEFCDAGTLWMAVARGAYLRGDGQPALHRILRSAVEIAEGLSDMHAHRIVHRDLTSRNVLLKFEPATQRTRAKVSDFGLSMLLKPGQEQAVALQHGSLAYMPPELLTSAILSFATDVYSFGMLLWEMISSKTPYAGLSEQQILHRKLHEAVDVPSPADCPAVLADLMQACLSRQPSQRPTMPTVTSRLHSLLATFWSDEDS